MKKILAIVLAFFASVSIAFAAVNINTASKEQLDSLPGVGPVKAQAIIDYRTKNGPFKSLEDIKKVNGIGDKTFEELKSHIALSGTTKVDEKKADAKPAAAAKADAKAAPAKAESKAAAPAKKEEKAMAADAKKADKKEMTPAEKKAAAADEKKAKADKAKADKEAKAAKAKADKEAKAAKSDKPAKKAEAKKDDAKKDDAKKDAPKK